jgi:hypothetical protein
VGRGVSEVRMRHNTSLGRAGTSPATEIPIEKPRFTGLFHAPAGLEPATSWVAIQAVMNGRKCSEPSVANGDRWLPSLANLLANRR